MTTCVATICEFGTTIVAASDRMLTIDYTEYEPGILKFIGLTNSIVMLWAGDASMAQIVAQEISEPIGAKVRERPEEWCMVADIATSVAATYVRQIRLRVQRALAAPKPLTATEMASVRDVLDEEFRAAPLDVIIAGTDPSGAHIYGVRGGQVACHDYEAFAAIGAGAPHAVGELMRATYSASASIGEALVLTYAAKRRSEMGVGVGEATDMLTVGPGLGTFRRVNEIGDLVLGRYYQELVDAEKAAFADALIEANSFRPDEPGDTPPPQRVADGPIPREVRNELRATLERRAQAARTARAAAAAKAAQAAAVRESSSAINSPSDQT